MTWVDHNQKHNNEKSRRLIKSSEFVKDEIRLCEYHPSFAIIMF